jgi:signal transduction histidine kinase
MGISREIEVSWIILEENKPTYYNYGIVSCPKVFFIVLDPSEDAQYLLIENPHINSIQASIGKVGGVYKLGDHQHFENRLIQFRQFVLPLPQRAHSDTIRLELDKSRENLSFGLRLLDEESFRKYQVQDERIIGFIFGFSFFSFLIGIILMPKKVSRKSFFFLLYLFFSMFWLLNDAGLFFQYLWKNNPLFHSISRGIFSTLSMGFFGLFVYSNNNYRINAIIKKIFLGVILFISIKLVISFLIGFGVISESIKKYYIFINSFFFLFSFGFLIILTAIELVKKKKYFYELNSVLIYCIFVFSLSASEIGITFFRFHQLHQLDPILFFILQILLISIQIKQEELILKIKAVEEFSEFRISQERNLLKRILEVENFERKRIAQNIHDDIGSVLAAIKYQILFLQEKLKLKENQSEFVSILNLLDDGVENQYSIIEELIPKFDRGESLEIAIKKRVDLIFVNKNIDFDLFFFLGEDDLSSYQKTQIYRILIELLTNTLKHSNGTYIKMFFRDKGQLEFEYTDNGSSFFQSEKSTVGSGLENIKFRVGQMNGKILDLSFHNGFRILFLIPKKT